MNVCKLLLVATTALLLSACGGNGSSSKENYVNEMCKVTYDQYEQGTTGADSVLACQDAFSQAYDEMYSY